MATTATRLLRRLLGGALDVVFPPRCVGCDRWGAALCSSCRHGLPRLLPPFCARCSEPLAGPSAERGASLCVRCRDHPLAIDGIRSPYLMEGAIRRAILELKYQGVASLAVTLGRLLHDYLEAHPLPADVIVPLPLHSRRQRRRGFNQAALLAKEVGRLRHRPVGADLIVRVRNSPSQAQAATAEERRANVKGAFQVREGAALGGKRVLLVDDVCTTGATLDACARALKEAGAAEVWGLTVARER
ncbi:MAG: ComF family protein [Chloroflexi bacterium]|nr:ComF family protein [Chloroflexota bacterium]